MATTRTQPEAKPRKTSPETVPELVRHIAITFLALFLMVGGYALLTPTGYLPVPSWSVLSR